LIRDGNIRYYEYDSDTLYALSEHKSTEPQRGMCFLPRRAVEVSECEIGRAYKVTGTAVEAIAFIVPRKVNFNFVTVHVRNMPWLVLIAFPLQGGILPS